MRWWGWGEEGAGPEETSRRLLALETRIGASQELGLQGELRGAIHAIEPAVKEVLAEAVWADEHANRTLVVALLVNCLIVAALLALAIFFAQATRLRNRELLLVNRRMEEDHAKLLRSERLAAIGQMVAGLTHESRNALQRTHACLDMLSHEIEDRPRALSLLGRIEESQDDLHTLYEQVREYAAPLRVSRVPLLLESVVSSA